MIFQNRTTAGKMLAEKLLNFKASKPLVLALPRGGVPVGFEIAKRLKTPLDILAVRKLGAPSNSEFGIGAIAPGNIKILDEDSIKHLGITPSQIDKIAAMEKVELKRRLKLYRGSTSAPKLKGQTIILVDDGLATGVTARAAIKSVLLQKPKKLILAVPVCAYDTAESLRSLLRPTTDELVCLSLPHELRSVGAWYMDFSEVTDREVIGLLKKLNRGIWADTL